MPVKLTATSVAALKKSDKRYAVADTEPGLQVIVMPTGAKTFAARYRLDGRFGKVVLGSVESMTLAEAREAAREAMRLVRSGIDPARKKQDDKAARIAAREAEKAATDNLMENVVDEFIRRHVEKLKSRHEVKRLLKKEVAPKWKGRRIESLTKRDVLKLIDGIEARGAATTARRTFAHIRKMMNWALGRDYAGYERSPCEGLGMPSPEVKRDRVLSDDELRLVLRGADKLDAPWREFVRLLVYTAARRSEVAAAPWSEFSGLDGDAKWEIPGERTKNGRPHILPLPADAALMLHGMPRIGDAGLVFTVTGATPVMGFSDAKERLDAVMLDIAREDAAKAATDPDSVSIAPWRWHDIRRTVATGMAAMQIAPHVVEAVLNHASGVLSGVAGVYNRYSYLDEKKATLAAWADHIARLEGRAPATNVIPLRA